MKHKTNQNSAVIIDSVTNTSITFTVQAKKFTYNYDITGNSITSLDRLESESITIRMKNGSSMTSVNTVYNKLDKLYMKLDKSLYEDKNENHI